MARPLPSLSVIVTTRNEAANIADLMRSLQDQEDVAEVVLVDADSEDRTVAEAKAHAGGLRLVVEVTPCTRGEGRNIAADHATGDLLAFIDGDCTADPGWTRALLDAWDSVADRVVAGRTVPIGRFKSNRAPILVDGKDITWPSCNLAYSRALFDRLGGFDETFLTAEDVDLNLRAVRMGAQIVHAPDAVVRARVRPTWGAYLKQAHDYGIGRAQLQAKHGAFARTSKRKALLGQPTPMGLMRLWMGWRGYRKGRRAEA